MAEPILDDDLGGLIEPLLPPPKPRRFRHPGRRPVTHRQALSGILFVLKTGIAWEHLPQELGYGCGVTCWRRLRDWAAAGVWPAVHRALRARLNAAGAIDWSRAAADSMSVRAVFGGGRPAPTRRTAARRAPSTTCSSTATGSPWPPT